MGRGIDEVGVDEVRKGGDGEWGDRAVKTSQEPPEFRRLL